MQKSTIARRCATATAACAAALWAAAASLAYAQSPCGLPYSCYGPGPGPSYGPDPWGSTSHPPPLSLWGSAQPGGSTATASYTYSPGGHSPGLYGSMPYAYTVGGPGYGWPLWYNSGAYPGPYSMAGYYPGPFAPSPAPVLAYSGGAYPSWWGAPSPYVAAAASPGPAQPFPATASPFALSLGTPLVAAFPGSAGSPSTILITVDGLGSSAAAGRPTVRGWAVDLAGSQGPGVQSLRAYVDLAPASGAGSGGLAPLSYSLPRPDVAEALGDDHFGASGFELSLDLAAISPGQHTLYIVVEGASGSATVAVPFTLRAS